MSRLPPEGASSPTKLTSFDLSQLLPVAALLLGLSLVNVFTDADSVLRAKPNLFYCGFGKTSTLICFVDPIPSDLSKNTVSAAVFAENNVIALELDRLQIIDQPLVTLTT